MKIAEAKQKLMQLAAGQYHCLEYKINDHGNGQFNQTCKVYINNYGSFEASHWETALAQLEDVIGERPILSEDLPTSSPAVMAG